MKFGAEEFYQKVKKALGLRKGAVNWSCKEVHEYIQKMRGCRACQGSAGKGLWYPHNVWGWSAQPLCSSPSCRQAWGKLQRVKISENLEFISSPSPKLTNLSLTSGMSLRKDSQSSALPLGPLSSAHLQFFSIQVYNLEFFLSFFLSSDFCFITKSHSSLF